MMKLFMDVEWVYLLRIVLSAVCGGLVGLERERRFKSAGIRTHMLVAMSSALMMIVSKYGFFDVIGFEGISIDASRIAAGVVTAIGFLGAGVIFIRKETTIGVTTAAGLWGTVGLGIAIGAGMYVTGMAFTLLMIIIQYLLHSRHLHLGSQIVGIVTLPMTDPDQTIKLVNDAFGKGGISIRGMDVNRNDEGQLSMTVSVVFRKKIPILQVIHRLEEIGTVNSVEVYTIN